VREAGLNEPVWHEIYCPYRQSETSWQWVRFLAVRTSGDPMAAVNPVRRVVAKIDPDLALNHVMTSIRFQQPITCRLEISEYPVVLVTDIG